MNAYQRNELEKLTMLAVLRRQTKKLRVFSWIWQLLAALGIGGLLLASLAKHPWTPAVTYVCCLARAGTMVYPIRKELDGDHRFGAEFDVPTNILCQVTATPCPDLEAP